MCDTAIFLSVVQKRAVEDDHGHEEDEDEHGHDDEEGSQVRE